MTKVVGCIKTHGRLARSLAGAIILVLALDAFLGFMPLWLSIPLGAIAILVMLYSIQPGFSTVMGRVMGNSQVQRLANAIFGCAGYVYVASNFPEEGLVIILTLVSLSVLTVLFGIRYMRRLTEGQIIEFWVLQGGRERIRAWEEMINMPESWVRNIEMFVWRYVPAVVFAFIALAYALLSAALTIGSVLFAFLLFAWILRSMLRLKAVRAWKRNRIGKPAMQKLLLEAFSASRALMSAKGIGAALCFIIGIGIACFWAWTGISIGDSGLWYAERGRLATLSDVFLLISIFLPSALYQIYFWYRIMRRYTSFLKLWETKDSTVATQVPSLPKGGSIALFISCFVPLIAFLMIFDGWYLVVISVFLVLVFGSLILRSEKDRLRDSVDAKLSKDNLRIPLATFSAICGLLVFHVLYSHLYDIEIWVSDMAPEFIVGSIMIFVLFYDEDVGRWVRMKYGGWARDVFTHLLFCLFVILLVSLVLATSEPLYRSIGWFLTGSIVVTTLLSIVSSIKKRKALYENHTKAITSDSHSNNGGAKESR